MVNNDWGVTMEELIEELHNLRGRLDALGEYL
jgi:hypothetical protein